MAATDFVIKETASGAVLKQYNGQEKEIVIPQGVQIIGKGAFAGNPHLVHVIIPEGVEDIEDEAFAGDVNLELVSLPASMSGISARAFRGCKNLRIFDVDPFNEDWSVQDGALLYRIGDEKGEYATWMVLCAPSAAGDYVIPESKQIRQIWRWAFADEAGIVSVTIPGTIQILRSYAFHGCRDLQRAVLCEGVEHMDYYVFQHTKKLKEVILPSTLKVICDGCFEFSGVETITLPPELQQIGERAFAHSGLKSISIPSSVEKLGKEAFRDAESLKEVTVACDVPTSCFAGCPVKSLTISGVVQIAASAFDSKRLKEVIAEEMPLRDLPKGPVQQAALLTFARRELAGQPHPRREEYLNYLKNQRKRLYPLAVKEKALLELMLREKLIPQADLPLVIEEAGRQKRPAAKAAVSDYGKALETAGPAKRPKKEPQKGSEKPADASESPKPRKAPGGPTVAEMKKIWSFKKLPDDTLQLTDYKICLKGEAGKLITVPAMIGKSAVTELKGTFQMKRGIHNAWYAEVIRLPEGLRVIGDQAFSGCDQLKELVLPDTVTQIGEQAFSNNWGLKRLRIPSSVHWVGRWAFVRSGLEEMILPDSVKKLGDGLFEHCEKLASVTLPKTLKHLPGSIFECCSALQEVELPAGLKTIGDRAFAESGLTSLVIPEGVMKIGRCAFFRCEQLQRLTIPASVEQIEDGAFGVSGLEPEKHISVTIHAPAGCYAEDYARRHQLPFEAL